jgi:hypothetical protein
VGVPLSHTRFSGEVVVSPNEWLNGRLPGCVDRVRWLWDSTGVSQSPSMPTTIKLNDRLAEKIAVLAAQAGQPVEAFVERVLQGLVDADIEIKDGIPVFRMPPNAPTLTSADVDRLLHSDLNS